MGGTAVPPPSALGGVGGVGAAMPWSTGVERREKERNAHDVSGAGAYYRFTVHEQDLCVLCSYVRVRCGAYGRGGEEHARCGWHPHLLSMCIAEVDQMVQGARRARCTLAQCNVCTCLPLCVQPNVANQPGSNQLCNSRDMCMQQTSCSGMCTVRYVPVVCIRLFCGEGSRLFPRGWDPGARVENVSKRHASGVPLRTV